MAITTAASRLGTEPYSEARRVELRPNASKQEVEAVIRAVYRQVLGNDYIMASERLTSSESLLRDGNLAFCRYLHGITSPVRVIPITLSIKIKIRSIFTGACDCLARTAIIVA